MVPNKAGVGKCVSCEEPAPNTKPASTFTAASTSTAANGGGGFNWAAARMKAPAKDVGGWMWAGGRVRFVWCRMEGMLGSVLLVNRIGRRIEVWDR